MNKLIYLNHLNSNLLNFILKLILEMSSVKLENIGETNEEMIKYNSESYKRNELDDNKDEIEDKVNKKKALKNLIIMSLSFFFQFSSYNSLSALQSSLNTEKNLGVTTLLTTLIFFTLSCLFIPMIIVKQIGFKWSFLTANMSILIYVFANFYPRFYTMLPAAVFSGIGQSIMWVNQGSYIAELAKMYAKAALKTEEASLVLFFGIFLIVFQLRNKSDKLII